MIILTQPGIVSFSPTKISSTIVVFTVKYCLAEVADDFNLNEEQMTAAGIDFWWCVQTSLLKAPKYKLRKYKGGIVEGIMEQLDVSKEINIAYGIYAIASERKADEFQVWERSVLSTTIL